MLLFYGMPNDKFDDIFPAHVRKNIEDHCEIVKTAVPDSVDTEYLKTNIGDAEVLVTSWGTPKIEEDVLSQANKLKLIAHAAGTVKPIVSDGVWERGIRVVSSAQAIAEGVAEFCLVLALTASKRVFWFAGRIREGAWSKEMDLFGAPFEIYRENVGIIGASYVGRKLIRLLQPFSCKILLYDPYCSESDAKSLGARKVESLDEIFSLCRVVSLNAPVTEETKNMIRGSHFAQLPDGAVFINTARGIIVNQEEMVAELGKGRFVACLDVTNPEPPALDDPLRRLPNVILTPHIAGAIKENRARIGELVAEQIAAYKAGNELKGEVTKDRLAVIA